MKKLKPIFYFLILSIMASCDFIDQQRDNFKFVSPEELMNVEKNFSRMSEERGMKSAFLHYIAKDGVILRPEESPISGADAIEYLTEVNDEGYSITWEPLRADISADGNTGYTYGIYTVEVNNDVIKGTYINVWKKQGGEWRFVLNSVNQGVGNQ